MNDEIKKILERPNVYSFDDECYLYFGDYNKLKDYITNLQTIADNRMDTILKIEKYCIEEKEDLISGGEVCEDVLKIVDELKGK